MCDARVRVPMAPDRRSALMVMSWFVRAPLGAAVTNGEAPVAGAAQSSHGAASYRCPGRK